MPPRLAHLQLTEFDIRDNPNMHNLPLELGRIEGLRVFWFDIDPITFPQRDITLEGPRSTLKFLRVLYDASKTGRLDLSSTEYNLQTLAIPVHRFTNLTELDLARNFFSEVCVRVPCVNVCNACTRGPSLSLRVLYTCLKHVSIFTFWTRS